MDTTELLENLNSCGRRLTTEAAAPDDLAKGVGFALLALGELIGGASVSGTPAAPTQGTAFKAKSNRW